MARLLSVNAGLPRDIVWNSRTVRTGIWKDPVRARCRVGRLKPSLYVHDARKREDGYDHVH